MSSPGGVGSARTFLYTPGTRPDRVAKALAGSADRVIIDLEDAVPTEAKDEARRAAGDSIAAAGPDGGVWVRINGDFAADDLAAVVRPGLGGIVVPKAEPAALHEVDQSLRDLERADRRPTPVIALIESAAGMLAAVEMARHPRVVRLAVGEADLAGELRVDISEGRGVLYGLRMQLVLASAAAGLAAPIGPVETALDDDRLLRVGTEILVRQGFRARTALHPRQIPVIHQVLTPSDDEVERARRYVAAHERAGGGGFRGERGEFVDAAVMRAARELIERAEHEAGGFSA